MNALPVLGAPLHWRPALLALTAIAVAPGVHLLASPLLEGRKVTWRDDYAAVLIGDPLLALAAGLGANISQPGGPRGWPASWIAGCAWLAGGWTFGLWQSRHEFLAGRYTLGQILSPTKLWHQFIVYPVLGYWVTAAEYSGLSAADTSARRLQAALVVACTATWAVLAWDAIRHPKPGHGTLDRTRIHRICSHVNRRAPTGPGGEMSRRSPALLPLRAKEPGAEQVIERRYQRYQREQRQQLGVVVALRVGRRNQPPQREHR